MVKAILMIDDTHEDRSQAESSQVDSTPLRINIFASLRLRGYEKSTISKSSIQTSEMKGGIKSSYHFFI